jgi:hypothetical protein
MSAILGLDASFALQMFEQVAEMEVRFQRAPVTLDAEDYPVFGTWADLSRTLPDGTTSTWTPCYFSPLTTDPVSQVTSFGSYEGNRYSLLVPYAPDLVAGERGDRVAAVRHAATLEQFFPLGEVEDPPRRLRILEIDHTHPVLSTLVLGEVR